MPRSPFALRRASPVRLRPAALWMSVRLGWALPCALPHGATGAGAPAAAGESDALPHATPVIGRAVQGDATLQPSWAVYVAPEFPASLRPTAVHGGFATVAFTFDDEGRIADRIILSASHPAFGDALLAVMSQWRMNPGAYDARARRDTRLFEFERHGVLLSGTQRDATRIAFNAAGDFVLGRVTTHDEAELDQPLDLIAGKFPAFPEALRESHPIGEVVLDFVVDQEGRVRVPAVTYATNPAFAAAVMAEVAHWRFSPPRHQGQATQAFLVRPVRFQRRAPE